MAGIGMVKVCLVRLRDFVVVQPVDQDQWDGI